MADILIRGMEMPTKCGLCPMFCDDFNDYCSAAQRSIPFDAEKPEWCPFVPLPEGHGRLIDAEAYVDYMQNRYDNNEITNGDWIDFRLSLKDQPTIVPAEGGEADGN